jgi:hypothetical protein
MLTFATSPRSGTELGVSKRTLQRGLASTGELVPTPADASSTLIGWLEKPVTEPALVSAVKRASQEDWRAAAWVLERHWPERWAHPSWPTLPPAEPTPRTTRSARSTSSRRAPVDAREHGPLGPLTAGSDRTRVGRVKRTALIGAVILVLLLPAAASARVRLARVTSPISHGSYAALTVVVSPAATCAIAVYYKSGPSHAAGLYPKRGARISWTWKVGTRTTPGRWPIIVSCGASGSLRTSFVVT